MVILCILFINFLGFRFCRLFAVCSVQCSAVCALSAASNSVLETTSPPGNAVRRDSPPRRAWQRAMIINYRCPLFLLELVRFLVFSLARSLIIFSCQEFVPELTSSECSS